MKLITHNEKFHLDEVLASVILQLIYPFSTIIRTRDLEIINSGDIVYDVGGIFDPVRMRFDHHQPTFNETYSAKYDIKLSSSGLIYKYFTDAIFKHFGINKYHKNYDELVKEIYEDYFLSADAHDNGYQITGDIVPRTLAAMVDSYNLNDRFGNTQDKAFERAMMLVGKDFDMYMKDKIENWLPSISILDDMVCNCDGPILISKSYFPFNPNGLLLKIEKKYKKDIKFVITGYNGKFKIFAIPKKAKYFENKVPLKKEWGGLRDKELEDISEIKGARFVHKNGFIGICDNLKGAIMMCEVSLKDVDMLK